VSEFKFRDELGSQLKDYILLPSPRPPKEDTALESSLESTMFFREQTTVDMRSSSYFFFPLTLLSSVRLYFKALFKC